MRIERAFPLQLWARVRQGLADRGQRLGPSGPRWRAAAAAIFIMEDSGLRITEALLSRRERLRYVVADAGRAARTMPGRRTWQATRAMDCADW